MKISVRNQTRGTVLGSSILKTETSAERRQGLLGRTSLPQGEGLWIVPCEGVHCFGMKMSIDVLHLDRKKSVKKLRPNMKPWRISLCLTGHSVLELPPGTIESTGTQVGDILAFEKNSSVPAAAAAALLLTLAFFTGCSKHTSLSSSTPPTPVVTAMDRQIKNATDAGEGDFLLRAIRARVISHPEDLAARMELGRAYEDRGYPELALEHFRLASERFPESADAHLTLARTLRAANLPGEAAQTLAEFLQAHPQTALLYSSWLGILQDDAAHYPEAEIAHRRAISLATTPADYLHNNLGYCLLKQGRHAEAAAEFRVALQINPTSEIARDNLGIALGQAAGSSTDAVTHFQSVNEPAAAHSNMAAVLIEQKRYTEARAEIAQALSYNRLHPAALANLKIVSELDGKPATVETQKPARTNLFSRARHAVWSWLAAKPAGEKPGVTQTAFRKST